MWHSNAPWSPTGYGTQTGLWVPKFAELGHDMAISAFYGLMGARTGWGGIPVYPGGAHLFGTDVLAGHAKHFGADLVICLGDPFAQDVTELAKLNTAFWTPVDREPLGKLDTDALSASRTRVIALSMFGENSLRAAGFDPLYVPHGIDTSIFRPPKNRGELRKILGLPEDAFIIGINATNKDPSRKSFPEQFIAFAGLYAKHPDALLLVHTDPAPVYSGVDLGVLADDLGISKAIRWADQYSYKTGAYTQQDMAAWYGMLDLLSACSYGEGFGLPIIEAQACGVPVVVTDASAMTELKGPGWIVAGEPDRHHAHRAWWTKPYVGEIAAAYEHAYNGGVNSRREPAREFAMQYDADKVLAGYWQPVLEQLEAETEERKEGVHRFAGFKWQIDDNLPTGDALALGHEAALDAEVLGMIPEGGVFLDIGAHVGHYALRASRKALRVIAVEAGEDTANRLRHNLALNGIKNVEVCQVAAWDERTKLQLFSSSGHARDGSSRVLDGPVNSITALPLDDLLADEPRIDVVKMDVEGADLRVLRGMRETLQRLKPQLFIEDHSIYGYYERQDLNALLEELGYQWRDLPLYGGYVIAEHKEK